MSRSGLGALVSRKRGVVTLTVGAVLVASSAVLFAPAADTGAATAAATKLKPKAGLYKGKTEQGLGLSFLVANRKLTRLATIQNKKRKRVYKLQFRVRAFKGTRVCQGGFDLGFPDFDQRPAKVSGKGRFSFGKKGASAVWVKARFVTQRKVKGKVSAFVDQPPACSERVTKRFAAKLKRR